MPVRPQETNEKCSPFCSKFKLLFLSFFTDGSEWERERDTERVIAMVADLYGVTVSDSRGTTMQCTRTGDKERTGRNRLSDGKSCGATEVTDKNFAKLLLARQRRQTMPPNNPVDEYQPALKYDRDAHNISEHLAPLASLRVAGNAFSLFEQRWNLIRKRCNPSKIEIHEIACIRLL